MSKELYRYIGEKIRDLRQAYGGSGISQEALAKAMETTPNTVSRWETAVYKPTPKNLQDLATFFGVAISVFFPVGESPRVQALLSATGDLSDDDFDELLRYAQFRKARAALARQPRKKKASP